MTIYLLSALVGKLHIEDEVAWGIWIPPLPSLAISLCCLIFAFRHIFRLEVARLAHWSTRLWLIALALIAEFAQLPVINALDRVFRINW